MCSLRHWEQGSVNEADVTREACWKDQTGEGHRNTGGKHNTGSTGENEAEKYRETTHNRISPQNKTGNQQTKKPKP